MNFSQMKKTKGKVVATYIRVNNTRNFTLQKKIPGIFLDKESNQPTRVEGIMDSWSMHAYNY